MILDCKQKNPQFRHELRVFVYFCLVVCYNRTVDYFKYDIFGANDKGDIVVCEWSNWSGTLPSGASTSIDTMFKYNPEGTRYGAIMNKISYAY